MPIVVVNTDFVIHKEDEEWTAEEIEMLENYQPSGFQGIADKQKFDLVVERFRQGDQDAWKLLYD